MKKSRETLIYENVFDNNQEKWITEMREEWVMEGKGIAECGSGCLVPPFKHPTANKEHLTLNERGERITEEVILSPDCHCRLSFAVLNSFAFLRETCFSPILIASISSWLP